MAYIIIGITCLVVIGIVRLVRHQRKLRLRAHLMQEAIRNRDFTFRLPIDGLLSGERAMQEALNKMGQTIKEQVNQNEVETWERLTRVLTHEIMNAMAPISSISQSLLQRDDVKGTPLEEGIHAISSTSQHLNTFVNSYRKLSQLQRPTIEDHLLASIVKDVSLLNPTLHWQIDVVPDLTVKADANRLQQVLINLVKNAIEADAHSMGIEAAEGNDAIAIYVSNDGKPIPAEARSSIFVPFFTTKRTGSGIGLSLSRRMMIQQKGSLELDERARTAFHTTFRLSLPC